MAEPTIRTIERIRYLKDPETVDRLLDAFQAMGMPMGSDRWAEFCTVYIKELREKELTLGKLTNSINDMRLRLENCGSHLHKKKRAMLVRDFQQRNADAECYANEASAEHKP